MDLHHIFASLDYWGGGTAPLLSAAVQSHETQLLKHSFKSEMWKVKQGKQVGKASINIDKITPKLSLPITKAEWHDLGPLQLK